MNNSANNSITNALKKRALLILALLILTGTIVMNVTVKEPALEPDEVFPMANANITWLQSYHAGAWSETP